jgi:pimeloyl-ACP methyl ester carboxylesterase
LPTVPDVHATGASTRFIDANGLTFAADEAGEGDAIAICLHGFPEDRSSWRHQLAPLAALGWHVIAPDTRGYGDSSRPETVADYAMTNLVADVAALFDACGARRRLLVGHDWGAAIAWAFALRGARPLDGLIVMNVPHPTIFRHALSHSWAQRRRSWYMGFFQLPWLPEALLKARGAAAVGRMFNGMAIDKSAFPPDVLDGYRAAALKPGAMTAMLNYYRANLRSVSTARMPVIEVPTLMVWGEEDTALGLELTEGYEPLVTDFTLDRLPGVSHWVQQEAPGRVNDVMARWLRAKGLVPNDRA